MYRNRRVRRLLFFFHLFFFFFLMGLLYKKRVVTSVDLALALALATKSQIWSFFFFLFVNLQVSVCFYFILFYFFRYFCYFSYFQQKDGAMYLSFLLMTAKKSFYEQSYFSFLLFFSPWVKVRIRQRCACTYSNLTASLGNTAGFTLQCPIYFSSSSSSSATVKNNNNWVLGWVYPWSHSGMSVLCEDGEVASFPPRSDVRVRLRWSQIEYQKKQQSPQPDHKSPSHNRKTPTRQDKTFSINSTCEWEKGRRGLQWWYKCLFHILEVWHAAHWRRHVFFFFSSTV